MDNNTQQFSKLNLSENILKALNNLGFLNPSDVQREAIPKLLNKEDIIVKSQTGSGKTASYGIPICDRVEIENSNVQALILVPTRELALQVKEDISNIGRLKKIRCDAIFGKQPFNEQIAKLKQRVHIVVGTPGRVIDHIDRGNLKLESLKFVVIDEADKMLNMGFVDQIRKVLQNVPKTRTTALFSATIPEQIESLCSDYMKNPKILNIKSNIFNRDKIKESYLEVEDKDKFKIMRRKLYAENPEAAIVFCNTKEKVKNIFGKMKKEGFLVEELQGDMEQKDRIKTMERFKNKEFKVLVATDIAARGIHIDNITHVLNYEVPMEKESYVHRIGRTGRAGKEGKAITFVSNYENKFFKSIEEYIGYEVKKDVEPKDEEVKEGKIKFKESQIELAKGLGTVKQKIHNEVTKIHLNGGKKKKIRVIDIVGSLSNLKGLNGDDIGIIDIKDGFSYVDILNGKGQIILKDLKEITIKGKKIKIQRAKN